METGQALDIGIDTEDRRHPHLYPKPAFPSLTSRFPFNHGAPIHIGAPEEIGADLKNPIYGAAVQAIPPGVTPVFWACGVTPQRAAVEAKPDLMITHAPGHGFITDLKADQLCLP